MMEFEYLKEITVWDKVDYQPQNHSYKINKKTGKLHAYRKTGTNEVIEFAKPKSFSKSYRKFVKIKEF